ncbi:MAG: hypothetical protein LLG14_21675 [Nocardiaceae bacterium]|nr:hypothetical protein [Nocardiaceae bacterium]
MNKLDSSFAVWLAVGAGLGTALFATTGNATLIAVGIALAVTLSLAFTRKRDDDGTSSDDPK